MAKIKSLISDEVKDSNPYSRLMALKRMGVVQNYETIREFTVAIVGVGGVGSVAAEMLTRCGIGKLILFDYDKVELANMNRLFYQPSHAGLTKVSAAKKTLEHINPDVEIEIHTFNITTLANYEKFCTIIQTSGLPTVIAQSLNENNLNNSTTKPVDLILSCVDNYEARITINSACNEYGMEWMESGVSENAVSGHIQYMIPGITACFACVPPLLVAENIDEKSIKKEGVCAASLPTTMAIIAGLLVQNCLKKLLQFGQVSPYLGYNALLDYFPTITLRPSPDCTDHSCQKWQEIKKHEAAQLLSQFTHKPTNNQNQQKEDDEKRLKLDNNEWGIRIIDESTESSGNNHTLDLDKNQENLDLGHSGLKYQYEHGYATSKRSQGSNDHSNYVTSDASIEDLMCKLKNI